MDQKEPTDVLREAIPLQASSDNLDELFNTVNLQFNK